LYVLGDREDRRQEGLAWRSKGTGSRRARRGVSTRAE
jgi:hypothetical protein